MQGPNREESSEAQLPEEMDHKKSHVSANLFIEETMHSDAKGPFCLLLLITLWQWERPKISPRPAFSALKLACPTTFLVSCHKKGKPKPISTTIIIILVDYSEKFHDFKFHQLFFQRRTLSKREKKKAILTALENKLGISKSNVFEKVIQTKYDIYWWPLRYYRNRIM